MSLPPMSPDKNPVLDGNPGHSREGQPVGGAFGKFRGGESITTAMSAPTSQPSHTAALGRSAKADFVIRNPTGITAFTVHWGRWVTGPNFGDTGTNLDGWVEDGSSAHSALAAGELVPVTMDTQGDPVGIYVTALTGTASEEFRFWVRGRQ